MGSNGILATIYSGHVPQTRAFYVDVLGFDVIGDTEGEYVQVVSPANPTLRLGITSRNESASAVPQPAPLSVRLSVEVTDVDQVHDGAVRRGLDIVRPLRDEPDGRRHFVTLDPNGLLVDVVAASAATDVGREAAIDAEEQEFGFTVPPEVKRLSELVNPLLPWAVRVVATLRVADLIATGVTRLEELASRTETDTDAFRRLLRYLTYRGVFAEPESGVFALTPISELLQDSHPMGMRAWLDLDGAAARWDQTYPRMLQAVRTGQPVYSDMFGRSFWDDLVANPHLSASFDALMAQLHSWSVHDIVSDYDWNSVRHVVDVGGGNGFLLTEILRANPALQGTLLEKPDTAIVAEQVLVKAGLADRGTVARGNFFTQLPPGGDVYLVANVLHNWGDQQAAAILHRCAEAARPQGRVLVVEEFLGGPGDQAFIAEMDLLMLVALGGKKRTLEEFRAVAATAGITVRSVQLTQSGLSLVDCAPQPSS
jgi:catechol 2,3-dioxygenase-like lactoylglutathione lyase family enzyme